MSLEGRHILLGVSASIAAHRALDLASNLRKRGAAVRAVLTPNTTHLIGAAAFDAITGQRTITSLWDSSHAGEMDHLAVTKWAELFIICPATADSLATLAHGIAGDALGTFAVAWNKAPLLIAPAMNPEMWRNSAVQANIALLRERGHLIIEPVVGPTACEDVGKGRLAPLDEIESAIERQLSGAEFSLAGKHVLITCGPTREFADDVRCITNPSTGRQGFALATEAKAAGARVTVVCGPTSVAAPPCIDKLVPVVSADEMLAAVLAELHDVDIAIFAAAVSDWKPAERLAGKLKKSAEEMEIRLVRTPDIAAEANAHRRPGQLFVGFAAESRDLETYGRDKMQRKGFTLIFANPVNEPGAGFAADTNRGILIATDGKRLEVTTASKHQIARVILHEAAKRLG